MSQKIYPSCHILEMFMPYLKEEKRLMQVLEGVAAKEFYRHVELPTFADKENSRWVRRFLEDHHLDALTYVAPYFNEKKLALCDLDGEVRAAALDMAKHHARLAAEAGYKTFGVPSGRDPGPEKRRDAMQYEADALGEMAEFCRGLGMYLTLEPLDRYTAKKQVIGPMPEVCEWFRPIHEAHPNAFLHWDSAHEALGYIDLMYSLDCCSPFLSQVHLCDAITDPSHPCFGDLHMDCAHGPDWTTEGFLTPEVAAQILKKVASFDTPEGKNYVWASVEILGHKGNDLWHKEELARNFLTRAFTLAGLELA